MTADHAYGYPVSSTAQVSWPVVSWNGTYDASWKGFITPESFAHPAKFSRRLIERILEELVTDGILSRGDVVVDPFGGIGTGGVCAASLGLKWIGCELEEKFVGMAKQNFALHEKAWAQFGDPLPVIVQGDSRQLRKHLAGVRASCVVSSPPYSFDQTQRVNNLTDAANESPRYYGQSPGQLGAMPPGSVSAVLSSPPYADGCAQTGGEDKHPEHVQGGKSGHVLRSYADAVISSPPYSECLRGDNSAKETAAESQAKRLTPGGSLGQSCRHAGYGSEENLGNMPAGSVDAVVSSPPYSQSNQDYEAGWKTIDPKKRVHDRRSAQEQAAYGAADGQLGNLPAGEVSAVVSSPPYEGTPLTYDKNGLKVEGKEKYERRYMEGRDGDGYGRADGQLGQTSGETFWSAALEIVRECYAILKPGGYAIFVTKAFVRDKQLVDFPGDWRKLCESVGFETVKEVRASLVKEKADADLFGGEDHVKRTERKSFFRRLAEKKGSPRIDHETVWYMRKPAVAD